MRILQTLFCALFALSASATELQMQGVPVVKSWQTDATGDVKPDTVEIGEKEYVCRPYRLARAEEDHEFSYMEVTTTSVGELEALLGDKLEDIDSLVVHGPIGAEDFRTMWRSSLYGYLSAINLENAAIEDGKVPDNAFYHEEEQTQDGVFYYLMLRNIILPEGVEAIGNSAFERTYSLSTVHFPTTLRTIGTWAFQTSNINMDPLVLPEGLEILGDYAFFCCWKLKGKVVLPSTLKRFGDRAFSNNQITEINLPEGLESMGLEALFYTNLKELDVPSTCLTFDFLGSQFAQNRWLERVHLPDGLEEMPRYLLTNCINLKEVNIPHSVKRFAEGVFYLCSSLKEMELPLGVEVVEKSAFDGLASLEQMVFPASIKILANESCKGWNRIKRIYCAAQEPPVAVEGTFDTYDEDRQPIVFVPEGTKEKYLAAPGWSGFTHYVEIPLSEFPATAVEAPALVETDEADNAVYDLMGRRVTHPQSGHIYISKGKKVVF